MSTVSQNVAIIGAGLGGLACAIASRKQGLDDKPQPQPQQRRNSDSSFTDWLHKYQSFVTSR